MNFRVNDCEISHLGGTDWDTDISNRGPRWLNMQSCVSGSRSKTDQSLLKNSVIKAASTASRFLISQRRFHCRHRPFDMLKLLWEQGQMSRTTIAVFIAMVLSNFPVFPQNAVNFSGIW